MGNLTETDWWTAFVERLAEEPLDLLAAEFGVAVEDLEKALAELDEGGAITDTPGWPEVVRRVRAGLSIRHTARCFQTSPRRIRRGLARTAVRVAGVDVGAAGHPAMEGIADDLGKIPDGVLARRCGVTVEAVQGERRRLGIDAFRPAPSPERAAARRKGLKLAAPKRAKPQKVWQREEVDTQVVHRPTKRRLGVGRTPAVSAPKPTTGFAKGLQLPTLKPSSGSSRTMGERGWSAPPASAPDSTGSGARDGRGRTRRRVVRADADPIAAALGRKSTSVETSPATRPGKERTGRRRRVARATRSADKDGSDSGPPAQPEAPPGKRDTTPEALGGSAPHPAEQGHADAPARRSTVPPNVSVVASLSTPEVVIPKTTVHHSAVTPAPSVGSGKYSASVSGDDSVSSDVPVAVAAVAAAASHDACVPRVPSVPSNAAAGVPSVNPTAAPVPHISSHRGTAAAETVAPPSVAALAMVTTSSAVQAVPDAPDMRRPPVSRHPQLASVRNPGAAAKGPHRRAPVVSVARTAPAPVSEPRPVASLAAYHAALDGSKALLHQSVRVTDKGVFADRVPDVWRVRAGRNVLPVVAFCHSMLEAVLLVQAELDAGQMQNLSVWSDGPLG